MKNLRENIPEKIGAAKVVCVKDYLTSIQTNGISGEKLELTLHKSNVLSFDLDNDTYFIVRPSGTEPKIKFYFGSKRNSMQDAKAEVEKLNEIIADIYIKNV